MSSGEFAVEVVAKSETGDLAQLLVQFNREFGWPAPPPDFLQRRLAELIQAEDTIALLAKPGPVGLAVLRFRPALWTDALECTLAELYVVPEQRGRGLGRALLDRSLELARARGADNVELNTTDLDTAARRLYEAMGFSNLEEPERNASMLYYEREL